MRMRVAALAFVFTILSGIQFSSAQHIVKMTDQRWIELALDMIHKGVQAEDTAKVFMAFAPEISVKGKDAE